MSRYTISKTAIQGLGYKEVIEFLNNDISYDEMVDKLKWRQEDMPKATYMV